MEIKYFIEGNNRLLTKLITFNQVFNVFKYIMLIVFDFTIKERMILFDHSLFIGGIKVYIYLITLFGVTFSVLIKKLIYFTANDKLNYWRKLFDIICDKIHKSELDLSHRLDERYNKLIAKLVIRTKYLFENLKYFSYTFCKYCIIFIN